MIITGGYFVFRSLYNYSPLVNKDSTIERPGETFDIRPDNLSIFAYSRRNNAGAEAKERILFRARTRLLHFSITVHFAPRGQRIAGDAYNETYKREKTETGCAVVNYVHP